MTLPNTALQHDESLGYVLAAFEVRNEMRSRAVDRRAKAGRGEAAENQVHLITDACGGVNIGIVAMEMLELVKQLYVAGAVEQPGRGDSVHARRLRVGGRGATKKQKKCRMRIELRNGHGFRMLVVTRMKASVSPIEGRGRRQRVPSRSSL